MPRPRILSTWRKATHFVVGVVGLGNSEAKNDSKDWQFCVLAAGKLATQLLTKSLGPLAEPPVLVPPVGGLMITDMTVRGGSNSASWRSISVKLSFPDMQISSPGGPEQNVLPNCVLMLSPVDAPHGWYPSEHQLVARRRLLRAS